MALVILAVTIGLTIVGFIMFFSYIAGWFYAHGDWGIGILTTLYVFVLFALLACVPLSLM